MTPVLVQTHRRRATLTKTNRDNYNVHVPNVGTPTGTKMRYDILEPVYSAADSRGTFVAVDWKIVRVIEAKNAQEALQKAKALGFVRPVVGEAE